MADEGNEARSEGYLRTEIRLLEHIGALIVAQTKNLERLTEKVDDVRERVIKIEAQEFAKELERLANALNSAFRRIDQLESDRDQRRGGAAAIGWIATKMPWLWGALLATAGWFGIDKLK